MAELRNKNNNNNLELSSSSATATTSSSSRFPFLNRSLTTKPSQKAHHLDRAGSLTKSHNSVESAGNSIRGRVVKKLCNFFEPKPASSSSSSSSSSESLPNNKLKTSKSIENSKEALLKAAATTTAIGYLDSSDHIRLPGAEDRIVLYFTSLRGIRRTYEDCYAVRMIFRGFRVWVDERDISMDSAYKKELTSVLGEKHKNKNNNVTLPQVFIRGRYVGGSDVIKHLCEVGELGKILEGFPRTKPGFVCESCGDVRFAPCGNCSGSRKVFDEDEGLLKRCLECNENGLIRCPNCCS